MEPDFWHKKWENNEIGFHLKEANPLLVNNFDKLNLKKGNRIFLPLCGKTLDISWFLYKEYEVVGVELSKIAIEELFQGLGVEPKIEKLAQFTSYSSENIKIFVGDFFHLTDSILGKVNAIYDRAALVALPLEMRIKYTKHLMQITHKAPQLIICYEYDQSLLNGPPFSISKEEVKNHYGKEYDLHLLMSQNLENGFRGIPSYENVWVLQSETKN